MPTGILFIVFLLVLELAIEWGRGRERRQGRGRVRSRSQSSSRFGVPRKGQDYDSAQDYEHDSRKKLRPQRFPRFLVAHFNRHRSVAARGRKDRKKIKHLTA